MYCVRSDIEGFFGATNVSKWADINSSGISGEITARITVAIASCQAELDDRLRGGIYIVPLAEPPPATINRLCAEMSGIFLYESRGVTDYDPEDPSKPLHKFHWLKESIDERIAKIRVGLLRLNLTQRTTTPKVMDDDE